MISFNKTLADINMYDNLSFMFNDGRTSSTANANTKIGRFSSASYTEPAAGGGDYGVDIASRYFICYGVKNGAVTELIKVLYYRQATYYWAPKIYVNGIAGPTGSFKSWYEPHTYTVNFFNNKITINLSNGSSTVSSLGYDYVYFTGTLTSCTDLIIFDEDQNYFITNQDGISLLGKMNKELYNSNTNVSNLLTSYSGFLTSLTSVKSYMLTNDKITDAENNAPFYKLVKPAIKYLFDKTNRRVKMYSNRPITITPTLVHNGTDTLYMIHIPKNLNDDGILTSFYNPTTQTNIKQFIINQFKIGTIGDETADINIDYINRVDTIDELNYYIKLPNTIN